ncbi:MAG: YggT family protein [Rickettsiales bacterium]
MLNPFINLIGNLISLINIALIVWMVLSLLMNLDIINRHNQLIQRLYFTLGKLFEPLLRPIRKLLGRVLPDIGGIDLSPIVLILLLHFLNDALYSWFYTI